VTAHRLQVSREITGVSVKCEEYASFLESKVKEKRRDEVKIE
jgi:hypothetical protein